MILIGSQAALLRGVAMPARPTDLDLVGTRTEMERFRHANREVIESESTLHGHRTHFVLKAGLDWKTVEFDHEQSASDRMLEALCPETTSVLNSTVHLPGINVLYLTKRAHANLALNFQKTLVHMTLLKPRTTPFSAAETAYYEARKAECLGRFEKHPQRFTLNVSNDEFFAVSDHVRTYEHDDMHKAIAFTAGQPLYERCKRDLDSARIEQDLFLALPFEDQIRMVQEEFMVVGLERFYLHNRSMTVDQVYWTGMLKTVRDLFTGWFQNYCLDHADRLAGAAPYDFVARFEAAEKNGELRLIEREEDAAGRGLDAALRLLSSNRLAAAEACLLDLVKRDGPTADVRVPLFLGRIARQRGQNEIAAYYFRQALQADADSFEALNELGNALHGTGRPEQALSCYRQAIEHAPGFIPARVNLGIVLEETGQPDAALETYREALRQRGNDTWLEARIADLVGKGATAMA